MFVYFSIINDCVFFLTQPILRIRHTISMLCYVFLICNQNDLRKYSNTTHYLLHTVPGPPENLSVGTLQETSLTVSWNKPSNGSCDSYEISITNETDFKLNKTTNATTQLLDTLSPGILYNVTVYCMLNNLRSIRSASICSYTSKYATLGISSNNYCLFYMACVLAELRKIKVL